MQYKTQKLDNIYNSISDFNLMELNSLMTKVAQLRKQKLPTVLSHLETDLLRKINEGFPDDVQKRYNYLLEKKENATLNDKEYKELLKITKYSENINVQRVENVIKIAKIKNKTYDEIIEELELKFTINVA